MKSKTRTTIEQTVGHVPGLLALTVTPDAYRELLGNYRGEGEEVVFHKDAERQGFTVGTVVIYTTLDEGGQAFDEPTLPVVSEDDLKDTAPLEEFIKKDLEAGVAPVPGLPKVDEPKKKGKK